jgi:hypothetical protein
VNAHDPETEARRHLQRAATACYLAQLALMSASDLLTQNTGLHDLLAADVASVRCKAWLTVEAVSVLDQQQSADPAPAKPGDEHAAQEWPWSDQA